MFVKCFDFDALLWKQNLFRSGHLKANSQNLAQNSLQKSKIYQPVSLLYQNIDVVGKFWFQR